MFDSPMSNGVVKLESKSLSTGVSTSSALYGDDALCLDDDEEVDPQSDPAFTLAQMLVKGHEAGYAPDSLTMQIQVLVLVSRDFFNAFVSSGRPPALNAQAQLTTSSTSKLCSHSFSELHTITSLH